MERALEIMCRHAATREIAPKTPLGTRQLVEAAVAESRAVPLDLAPDLLGLHVEAREDLLDDVRRAAAWKRAGTFPSARWRETSASATVGRPRLGRRRAVGIVAKPLGARLTTLSPDECNRRTLSMALPPATRWRRGRPLRDGASSRRGPVRGPGRTLGSGIRGAGGAL